MSSLLRKASPRARPFLLAAILVFLTVGTSFVFDSFDMQTAARIALLPCYPALLAIVAVAGGFHSANGEFWIMPVTAILSVVLWWIVFAAIQLWRAR